MFKIKSLTSVLLVLCSVLVMADTPQKISARLMKNYKAMRARKILVSPIPKELKFISGPIDPARMVLVADTARDPGKLAVEVINSRLTELGCGKLAIYGKVQRGKYNLIIDSKFDKSIKRSEGYTLTPVKNGLRLRGFDRNGVLYAAVTTRGLFGRKDSKTVFHAAAVRDWPDIPLRQLNGGERTFYREFERDKPARYLNANKPWMHQLLYLKNNVTGTNTYTPFQDCFSPFRTTPDLPPEYLKRIREMNDYLKYLGVKRIFMTISMRLAALRQNGHRPEVKNFTLIPWHDLYFSWGYPELQTIAAKKALAYAKAAGLTALSLHPVDAGSVVDPEMWSTRDAASRKRYPKVEDRARADADLALLYDRVFKGSGVEILLTPYPYVAREFTRDGVAQALHLSKNSPVVEQKYQEIRKWAEELNRRLPSHITVNYREDHPEAVKVFASIFKNRKKKAYVETNVFKFRQDDHPLLSPYLATMCTFAPPYGHHVLRAHSPECYEPFLPITSEYMWNVYAPYYAPYNISLKPDPARLKFMAEYTCIASWGEEIGSIVADAFSDGLSIQYLVDPVPVERARGIKDILGTYTAAWKKLEKALKLFDQAAAKRDSLGGFKKMGIVAPVSQTFNQLRLMFYGMRIQAAARLAELQMNRAISQGKSAETARIARDAVRDLKKYQAAFDELCRKTPASELLFTPDQVKNAVFLSQKAVKPDLKKAISRIEKLDADKEKIFALVNVPSWLKQSLKNVVYVTKVKNNTITLDGKLNEVCWKKAVPYEHFIGHRVMKFAEYPIKAYFCRDDKNFYVSGVIQRKGLVGYKATETYGGESFQVFFTTADGKVRQIMVFPVGKMVSHITTASFRHLKEVSTTSKCKTIVTGDGWTFELAVPISELGSAPRKIMAAYERKPDKGEVKGQFTANAVTDGGTFFDPSNYRKIHEIKWPPVVNPDVQIYLSKAPVVKDTLLASGTGTNVEFVPVVESRRPMYQLKVTAQLFDTKKNLIGKGSVGSSPYAAARFTALPQSITTDTVYRQVVLKLTAEYVMDNRKTYKSFFFPLGKIKAETFRKFLKDQENLTFSAYVPRTTHLKEGQCSFEMKFTASSFRDQTLFHAAKRVLRHTNLTNNNSVHVHLVNVALMYNVADRDFKRRSMMTSVKRNQWNKCLFKWQIKDGKLSTSMTINGKTKALPGIKAWIGECDYLQFNALNTGATPAFMTMRNIVVNGKKIAMKDLVAGHAVNGGAVYSAAALDCR